MKDAPKIDPKSREVETRRIGLENRLKEKVVDAKHDPTAQKSALESRLNSTGEPRTAGKA
jgi:hypothetical protein